MLFLQLVLTDLRGYCPSRTPAQELMSPADTRSRFRVFTSVAHFCQDYSTESCISIHSTGVKIQILDWLPSSPRCFPSGTLQRQTEQGILIDPYEANCFNIQAEIWFVIMLMQKVSLRVCNSLGKSAPRLKQTARINAHNKATGWCLGKLLSL